MAQKNKQWIKLLVKILVIIILGSLWTSESFGARAVNTDSTDSTGADYYWVGGSGNWTDLSHWATSSGGSEKHTSLPTQSNNVYFDENSFTGTGQEVIINQESTYCRDMDWTGALHSPTIRRENSIDYARIRIYGSLTLIKEISLPDSQLGFSFRALTGDHQITTANQTFQGDVYFDGGDANWTLGSDLATNQLLQVTGGMLNITDRQIKAAEVYIGSYGNVNISQSVIDFDREFILYGKIDASETRIVGKNTGTVDSLMVQVQDADLQYLELEIPALVDLHNTTIQEVVFNQRGTISLTNQIGKLTFKDHGNFTGHEGSVDELILTPGKNYQLPEGGALNVKALESPGTCALPITLECPSPSNQAIIKKGSGSSTVSFTYGKNIITQGLTLSENTEPRQLYWVGGSGQWYDSSHWSLTSGGQGGACVPSAQDNVTFDENSFSSSGQVVTSEANLFCNNMDWSNVTNSPALRLSTKTEMNIYGSLVLSVDMTLENPGETIYFLGDSEPGKTIACANQTLGKDAIFDGNESEWTLADSLTVSRNMIIKSGRLTTNNQNINSAVLSILSSGELTLGNSTVRLSQRFVACGGYDAGTSLLIIGGDAYDGTTGFIRTTQNLYDARFTGENGILQTKAQSVSYVHNGWYECTPHPGGQVEINSLTFAENAEVQTDGVPMIIKTLEIQGDGLLKGDFNIDSLKLHAGSFQSLDSAVINLKHLGANGSCDSLIHLKGGEFQSASNITASYCILENTTGTGSGTFEAMNSIDLGDNTGWTIEGSFPTDLYWVGGSGSWSDASHWSLISGGAGGACLPNLETNVYFDENSFTETGQVVDIDLPITTFKSMDWTGVQFNPSLAGINTTILKCYGSLILSSEMSYDYQGESIRFLSKESEVIDFGGHEASNNFYLLGSGAEWVLASDLFTSRGIWLYDGTLDTDNFDITAKNLITGELPRNIDFANEPTSPKAILKLKTSTIYIKGDRAQLGVVVFNEYTEAGTSSIILEKGNSVSTWSSLYDITFLSQGSDFTYSLSIQEENIAKTFHNVTFHGTNGRIGILNNKPPEKMTFNKISFLGPNNHMTLGSHFVMDTLLLGAGHQHQISKRVYGKLEIKKRLMARGAACQPLTLKTYNSSDRIDLIMPPEAVVSASHLNLQGIHASGGAKLYAGEGSQDLGNNSGWIFESDPKYAEGFLGSDQELMGAPVTLDANHFDPGISYLWSTGATSPSITVDACGRYSVQVFFESGCVAHDTVQIFSVDDLSNDVLSSVKDATCGQKGEVEIDRSMLSGISAPYQVTLTDLASGQILTLEDSISTFEGLTEGNYELLIEDAAGCRYVLADEISIELDESSCRSSVISPDFGETLTVPFEGIVKIYDRNGRLIRRFDAPGEWDGRDQNGQVVPIGIYLLISEDNRNDIIEATVVR